MAFAKVERPVPRTKGPIVTFYPWTSPKKSPRMHLSIETYRWIGEPTAVHFEWDDEGALLRVVASSRDDRHAYPIDSQRRTTTGDLFKRLGLHHGENIHLLAVRDAPLALIVDLSEYRSR